MSDKNWSPRLKEVMRKMTVEDTVEFLYAVAAEVDGFVDEEWADSVRGAADTIQGVHEEQGISLDTKFFERIDK